MEDRRSLAEVLDDESWGKSSTEVINTYTDERMKIKERCDVFFKYKADQLKQEFDKLYPKDSSISFSSDKRFKKRLECLQRSLIELQYEVYKPLHDYDLHTKMPTLTIKKV